MKKIRYIAYLALAISMIQACTKDFLELEPKTGQVEANFYKTENDAFLAVTAIYDGLSVQNWQFVPLVSDIFSDDAFAGGDPSGNDQPEWQEIEKSKLTIDNRTAKLFWSRCYSTIYRANLYLEKEGGIAWTNSGNRKRLAAEARFLRGYIYWDLARHYGWVPLITTVLPDIESYRNVVQKTPSEVYTQVAKDLLAALPDLPVTLDASETGRVTKYAAEALISRIYLYYNGIKTEIPELGLTGEWTNDTTAIDKTFVKTALDDIITNGGYSLVEDYAELFDWNHQNSSESIFEWQYSEKAKSSDWSTDGGWGINGNFSVIFYGMRNPTGFGDEWDPGYSFATITWSLLNEYEAGDPRKDATVFYADPKAGKYTAGFENTGYFNKKWMPRTAFQANAGSREHNYAANFIDIRLADVFLMAAEINLAENPGKAAEYLNKVRTRAMGESAAKNSITLQDIMHERRVELAGEGSRKWDLLRSGLNYAKTRIDASFVVPETAPNKEEFQGRYFDTETWGMLPIPGYEIRNCNAGVLKQYVPKFK